VDLKGTYDEYYGKYKGELGSANAQQVINKNNEAWSSFFSLLKLRKENKLPSHMNRVSPPSYWKDEDGRKLMLVVREDNYVVDELNHKLILKYFKMEISFTGRLRWLGKQGRLEIYYDEVGNAWYASIPVEVGVEKLKREERVSISFAARGRAFKLSHPRVIK